MVGDLYSGYLHKLSVFINTLDDIQMNEEVYQDIYKCNEAFKNVCNQYGSF